MSHICYTCHFVFGTWHRSPTIVIDHDKELYKFIYDFAKSRKVKVWRIGGMPDHLHLLCDLPSTLSIAEFARLIKAESSKFMKANPHFPMWDRWADGYGAFSVSSEDIPACINYIRNQKQHHSAVNFTQEYLSTLRQHGCKDIDEMFDTL